MGLFNSIKNMFKKDKNNEGERLNNQTINANVVQDEISEDVQIYEKGLTKTRATFVSRLMNLTKKYNKITEEYFEETE